MNSSADILKQAIDDKGLSWPQFAHQCGMSYGQLLSWLMRTYLPDPQMVQKVARAANLDETDMLRRVDEDKRALFMSAIDIVSRIGLADIHTIRQIPGGRNFVFMVNEKWVLKVACDELDGSQQLLRDQAIYKLLASHQEIPAAKLVGTGREPAPWLVIYKVEGMSLGHIWKNMAHKHRCDVCFQVGQLMARLHDLPCEELRGNQHIPFYTSKTWGKLVAEGIWETVRLLRQSARYSESQIRELKRYIVNHESLLDFDFHPDLLFCEHYDMHVCFARCHSGYSIAGMFDFGSVIVSEPGWDFVYANCSFLHQSPDYIVNFRKGYETILAFPTLSLERLTLYTIWADQGIEVWHSDREAFDTSMSLVDKAQKYWRHWL